MHLTIPGCFFVQILNLMRNKFLLKVLALCLMAFAFVSCKKDKDDPANVVEDANGITVSMSWTMNDQSSPSSNADLDLYLYKGTGANMQATSYYSDDVNTSSESFILPASLEDGDYTLAVDYFEVISNGKQHFTFTGTSSSADSYSIHDVAFTTTDENTEKNKILISKSGNKFTITQL